MAYRKGLNTKHWNTVRKTKHIGILNVMKFGYPMVQKQDGHNFAWFSNGLDYYKTKLVAILDCFCVLMIYAYC